MSVATRYRIAAIVPCHNEEVAVATVVRDLIEAIPGMTVYVYDNGSTDETADRAADAGAVVCREPMLGKGNAVRRAFADIDADIYLLIDGDDTYDAAAAPEMVAKLVADNLDQVVGVRRGSAYRQGHERGNRALNRIVGGIFGDTMGDMLSGYRVFSRRFVKSFPAVSREFEIETELTVHSLALRIPSETHDIAFSDRAEGSESKLRTYRDGWKILNVILNLTRHERPIYFYGLISVLFWFVAAALAAPVIADYVRTGMVPRLPSLVVASFLVLIGCLCFTVGLIMDGTRKARHEVSRLSYVRHPSVRSTYVRDPEYHDQPPVAVPLVPAPRAG
ncbi:glycosyltransferase family 2 protein [Nocardioides mangrovi]|uniref:Glycosyltransferase family 2 protein n=1 Tax=Nocardioides mangrovi TaxID=2874580 RepID=A0ABS7U9K8_9ACTN|nr:glycosyltransferase family 2 protein [Nocardioides mangrovi]MBZ5737664.1 glycosyltransferase family 2 protein [Nocardioides mangrovi]